MRNWKYSSAIVPGTFFWALFCPAFAEDIRVAAASNIAVPMQSIAAAFESNTSHKVLLSFGSTGKHYAQIRHGAPFDLFFAADENSPERLASEGLAVPDTLYTYAVGHLVLWSRDKSIVDSEGSILAEGAFERLAMANPKHAPYGRAAREVLESLGTWDALQKQIVRGENVTQAFQFVATGNAEIGLVAYSQIIRPGQEISGSWWLVPDSMYNPIRQQAVLIHDKPAARRFLEFVAEPEPQRILVDFGYGIPLEQSTRNAD